MSVPSPSPCPSGTSTPYRTPRSTGPQTPADLPGVLLFQGSPSNANDHFAENYEVVVEFGYPSAAQQAEQDESDGQLFPAHTLNEELGGSLGDSEVNATSLDQSSEFVSNLLDRLVTWVESQRRRGMTGAENTREHEGGGLQSMVDGSAEAGQPDANHFPSAAASAPDPSDSNGGAVEEPPTDPGDMRA